MRKLYQNIIPLVLLWAFILGNHNGYVALWEEGKPEPRQIFPYPVTSLPQEDQLALESGIRVRDLEGLKQLMEDYLS